jgi:hypothetical protein
MPMMGLLHHDPSQYRPIPENNIRLQPLHNPGPNPFPHCASDLTYFIISLLHPQTNPEQD